MKKYLMYTYLGKNGGVLTTPILIEGAYYVTNYQLTADEGKMLTRDDINFTQQVIVGEDEISQWREVSGQK